MEVILTQPSAAPVIQALRAIGYTGNTAIADLVDNCIDAKATRIDIEFKFEYLNGYIMISDNGTGMDEDTLQQAMNIGSKDARSKRSYSELGRFGMGLKTASFSLGKRLSVLTRKNGLINERSWDLDYVAKCNEWNLFSKVPNEIKELMTDQLKGEDGTVVVIDQLDRFMNIEKKKISLKNYNAKVNRIRKHLDLVFHSIILNRGIKIYLNDNKIEGWDPFLKSHPSIIEGEEMVLKNPGHKVIIKYYILPHPNNFNKLEYNSASDGKPWRERQGFYIYRENRLLYYGDWLNLFPKDDSSQLARVRIDITNEADEDWQVDVKKSSLTLPESSKEFVQMIANRARDISKEIFYFRTQTSIKKGRIQGNLNTWENSGKNHGPKFIINKSHSIILDLLNEITSEQATKLNTLIKLIELGSPVNISAVPNTHDEETQEVDENQKEILLRYIKILIVQKVVKNKEDMISVIIATSGFENINESTIAKILIEGGIIDEL